VQGVTLQELADSYDRSISTMRRATRTARANEAINAPLTPQLFIISRCNVFL
jgi:hypothetical protein